MDLDGLELASAEEAPTEVGGLTPHEGHVVDAEHLGVSEMGVSVHPRLQAAD